MTVDVDRRCLVVQNGRQCSYNDGATLRPLIDAAHQRLPIALVLADAEHDSERHHQQIRSILGPTA